MSQALTLPSELTIHGVAELRARCLDWLVSGGGDDAAVDGAAVDEVDAAGLQLLVALRHSAAALGRRLCWVGRSTTLCNACEAMGLRDLIEPSHDDEASE